LAAGGVNSSGSGGPVTLGSGTYTSNVNYKLISFSFANNGVGETYPEKMLENSIKAHAAVLEKLGRKADCVTSHKEWTGQQSICPGRKSDPYGPWGGKYAGMGDWGPQGGTAPFGLNKWRELITDAMTGEVEDMPLTQDEINKIAEAVWSYKIDTTNPESKVDPQPARFLLHRAFLIVTQYLGSYGGKPMDTYRPSWLNQILTNTKPKSQ